MTAYKIPYHTTIGFITFFVNEADGKIFGVPVTCDEIPEGGIGEMVENLATALAAHDCRPLNEEEHAAWAGELAARHQQEQLAAAMREQAKFRAIDPARMDAILRAHKGAPGGDA